MAEAVARREASDVIEPSSAVPLAAAPRDRWYVLGVLRVLVITIRARATS